ncbi:MAG TPA: alpha/beta fold hydrolase [Acetobacteraceae bacterium]|nr:alpha/beta fold hydrolase [Acetobacteraceae bacterium]
MGELPLACGEVLEDAEIAYALLGAPDAAGGNIVLLPSYFTGTHASYASLIGPGRALDPGRYGIVLVDMLGNGRSSSPSNHGRGAGFPLVSIGDNIRAQHALLTRGLGIERIALVAGWSLGAMQALHWAMQYPAMVERVMAICGTAYCWPLNQVFLSGVAAALRADAGFADGTYRAPPVRGLRAFGRAYAGWAYSAEFFRDALYRSLGFATLESFLEFWEEDHLAHDANDLLAVLGTWRRAAPPPPAERAAALGAIAARTVLMPCDTDAYFTLAEAALEGAAIPGARMVALHSPFGHCAGAPGRFAAESDAIERETRALLAAPCCG